MIHLHLPVIKERHHPLKDAYWKKHCQTSPLCTLASISYIETFFSDSIIRETLLKLFSLLEPWIYLKTNVKLIDNELLPLYSDEKIEIVYGGDNIINYYFNWFKVSPAASDFVEEYLSFFQPSFFEADLLIKTYSTNRFEILEKYAIESLVEILDWLTDGFEALLHLQDHARVLDTLFQDAVDDQEIDIEVDYQLPKLNDIKNLLGEPSFSYSMKLLTGHSDETAREANYLLINKMEKKIANLGRYSHRLMFYPYFYYFTKLFSKAKLFQLDTYHFENKIKNEINKQFRILAQNQFYQKEKIFKFKKKILTDLKNFPQRLYQCLQNVEIPKLPNNYDLSITPCRFRYLYNDIRGTEQEFITSISDKKHYCVIDQTFAMTNQNNKLMQDFDFVHLELGLLFHDAADELFNISPRLFCLKIIRINDSRYNDYMKEYHQNNHTNVAPGTTGVKYIKVHEAGFLANRLADNLFNEQHFLPWYIEGYQTKIVKLLFLLHLRNPYQTRFLNRLLRYQTEVSYSTYFGSADKISSFYDVIHIDPYFYQEYPQAHLIIKFIIVMREMQKMPARRAIDLLETLYTNYGWDNKDDNYENIISSYISFEGFLLKITHCLLTDD